MITSTHLSRRLAAFVLCFGLLAAACTADGDGPALDTTVSSDTGDTATSSPETTNSAAAETTVAPTTTTPTASTIDYLLEEERLAVPNQPAGFIVGLYGDSLFDSAREIVRTNLETGGRLVPRDAGIFSGSSLCTFSTLINQDIETANLWGSVIWFSGNNIDPCTYDNGERTFENDFILAQMEQELNDIGQRHQDRGIHLWLPNIPISRSGDFLGRSMAPGLNEMISRVADNYEMVEVIDVASSVLDENGRYTETLPCLEIEPCLLVDEDGNGVNFVREPDGSHFCTGTFKGAGLEDARWGTCPTYSSGTFRIALALTKPIIETAYVEWAANPFSQNPPVTLPPLSEVD